MSCLFFMLKLLPLCLYVEMHDLLMYLSLVNSKYDISIAVESSKKEKLANTAEENMQSTKTDRTIQAKTFSTERNSFTTSSSNTTKNMGTNLTKNQ